MLLLRYSLGLLAYLQLSLYRSRRHSCPHFGIPWACLSCNCSRFTEVAGILAFTSVFLGLACLSSTVALPKQTAFLPPLRYPLGLFVLQLLPVYRSSRHSCPHFGIPPFDLTIRPPHAGTKATWTNIPTGNIRSPTEKRKILRFMWGQSFFSWD